MYIKKRIFTLILSFLIFLLAVACGYVVTGMRQNGTFRAADGYGYQNSIASLATALDGINDSLQKSVYASTPYRMAALGAEVLASAESARTALSSLPTYELRLDKTNEFLDRVGDYSLYLTRRAINGEEISDADKANLLYLSQTAAALADKVSLIEADAVNGNMDVDEISALFEVPEGYWEKVAQTAASGGSTEPGNRFLELETLFPGTGFVYDGEYSDHLKNAVSSYLEAAGAVTEREAVEKAAVAAGCTPEELTLSGDVGTKSVKCYAFTDKNNACSVYITKQGGYLQTYSCGVIQDADGRLSTSEAEKKAEAYLAKVGYGGLTRTYSKYQGGTLLLTYVSERNGVRIYPEKVDVGVSLADGSIVYCDASEYLMCRRENRRIQEPSYTEEAAVAGISDKLTVESVSRAVIMTSGQKETVCHEIYCRAEDGTRLIVYINAATGAEEDSLLLTDNEEGFSAR